MGRVFLSVGTDRLFRKLDTTTNVGADVIFLSPLPSFAITGTSQVTGVVAVRDGDGILLNEVMGGEIGALTSVGSFSYGADGIVRLAFEKGRFITTQDAEDFVANYSLVFELQVSASYIPNRYIVKTYDMGHPGVERKTFETIVIGDEQLLGLMKAKIGTANLQKMNPFRFEIFADIRV